MGKNKPVPRKGNINARGILAVPNPAEPTIVLATDASSHSVYTSLAWLATSGHYGLQSSYYPQHISGPRKRSTVAELRAVDNALGAIRHTTLAPIHLLTDSDDTIQYLTLWGQGKTCMPPGYKAHRSFGKTSKLVRLADRTHRMVKDRTLTWSHVRAHQGHPLNETADSMAKLGLRAMKKWVSSAQVKELAHSWALQTLSDYVPTPDDLPDAAEHT